MNDLPVIFISTGMLALFVGFFIFITFFKHKRTHRKPKK